MPSLLRTCLAGAFVVAVVALPAAAATKASKGKGVTFVVEAASMTTGVGTCTSPIFNLPAGKSFVLESAVLDFSGPRASDQPRAAVRLVRKAEDLGSETIDLPIPTEVENGFSSAGGVVQLHILIRPNTLADAAVGDIYGLGGCFNRGTAGGGGVKLLITGTKA